jgi:hypothetical protein
MGPSLPEHVLAAQVAHCIAVQLQFLPSVSYRIVELTKLVRMKHRAEGSMVNRSSSSSSSSSRRRTGCRRYTAMMSARDVAACGMQPAYSITHW